MTCPTRIAIFENGKWVSKPCSRLPDAGGPHCRRHKWMKPYDREDYDMIRCTNPDHPATCEALMLKSDTGGTSYTCRTSQDRIKEVHGVIPGWTEHPYPPDRPMWIYDGKVGREYWIDPVTREECAPPATRMPGYKPPPPPTPRPKNISPLQIGLGI